MVEFVRLLMVWFMEVWDVFGMIVFWILIAILCAAMLFGVFIIECTVYWIVSNIYKRLKELVKK